MSIYKKLFEAKKEIGKISKDSTNPFYKSKYFDINQLLEHVEPILQKNGILLIQPIFEDRVTSILIDSDDPKEDTNNIQSSLTLNNQTDPQKRGSEITYYRRYTLQSLLGLQAEDDDANATIKQPTNEDSRPWLTDEQYKKALGGTPEQIQTVFKKFKIKKEYRTALENKLK